MPVEFRPRRPKGLFSRVTAGFLFCGVALRIAGPAGADTRVLTVGVSSNYQYRTISAAVAAADADSNANNYYDIVITPGTYTNDFPVVTRPMTITVDPKRVGNPVLLKATVPLPNQKGIILALASLTVDGLTFMGATIDNSLGGNGTGIRDQNTGAGATLIVRNSIFV